MVRDSLGTYSEYHDLLLQQEKANSQESAKNKQKETKAENARQRTERSKRLSYKEQREFGAIEKELEALNLEKEALDADFNSGKVIDDIAQKAQRYEEIKELIDEKEMRWLELNE